MLFNNTIKWIESFVPIDTKLVKGTKKAAEGSSKRVGVTTAGIEVSSVALTSQISMDEITLAKALIDIKTSKPKSKGIVMQEPSETPTPTPIDSSQ
nr:hypothetical protein [Tanacetum cinerariifolium]